MANTLHEDLCRACDVFVGYAGAGVAKPPEGRSSEWLADHCWICGRSRREIRDDPAGTGAAPVYESSGPDGSVQQGWPAAADKTPADSEHDDDTFAEWVILELMGHRRLAGYLREVEVAGVGFLRLDTPAVDGVADPVTQLYRPGAVYCITPVSEDVARRVAASSWAPPVSRLELAAQGQSEQVPAPPPIMDNPRLVEDFGASE